MMSSNNKGVNLLIYCIVFLFPYSYAQVPTYTVDNSFNTGVLFRDAASVSDIHILDDGRYLVGGGFSNHLVSPVSGFGMVYSNGNLDQSWGYGFEFYYVAKIIAQEDGYVYPRIYGMSKVFLDGMPWGAVYQTGWSDYFIGGTFNPYNVKNIWDIYQMENGDLLLGGAIANDTLLPYTFRGVSRIHADGSHDPTFPVLDITPNSGNGAVNRIFRAPNGAWYISGGFRAINGHETNRIARLTSDFQVDTTFVSPFMQNGTVGYMENIILVDNQSRVWVSGYNMRLQENPNDTIQIVRLLPGGEVDSSFLPRKLENNYPTGWHPLPTVALRAQEMIDHPDKYFIYGQFNYFQDTLQPCITVVNDAGIIQHNFFQDQGATINVFNDAKSPKMPKVNVVKQLSDGSLLIGGGFSEFMGQTHYSVVKLKRGFVGVEENEQGGGVKVYPNPATDVLRISSDNANLKSGVIFNAVGQEVISFSIMKQEAQVDIRALNPGIYFVKINRTDGQMLVKKFVKGSL